MSVGSGEDHITSNRIHPYFARIAAGAILASASATSMQAVAGEGHVYEGEIEGGAWVDAQHLKPGDELLGANERWQRVETVEIEALPLEAYNLSVDEYSTYFVAGAQDADAVWVHNVCFTTLPGEIPDGFIDTGEVTKYGQKIFEGEGGRLIFQSISEPTKIFNTASTPNYNPSYWNKEINFQGNRVHQRDDLIDPNRLDDENRTNLERMQAGLAPIGPDGESINLHHLIQTQDGAIAEVTKTLHSTNHGILHINDSTVPSGIHRPTFNAWKRRYWMSRANDFI